MKKIVSAVLALMMLLTCLPMQGVAAEIPRKERTSTADQTEIPEETTVPTEAPAVPEETEAAEEVITEENAAAETAEETVVELENGSLTISSAAAMAAGDYVSKETAVVQLREKLKQRATPFTIYVQTADPNMDSLYNDLSEQALVHTGVPTEGDYIRHHLKQVNADMSYYSSGGNTYVTLTYTVTYLSTAQQEAALDTAFASVMDQLALSGKTEYGKIKAIYDYITHNVNYDYGYKNDDSYLVKYSAYAALVQKMCVCQGYANLFYRMALAAGVDCRIITGMSMNEYHAWNIVRIGNLYYNADTTWDAGTSAYTYFLKSNADFDDHTRDLTYANEAFLAQYPMSGASFQNGSSYAEGDFVVTISGDSATLTAYTGKAANVTIPSMVKGVPVIAIGNVAFKNNTNIQSVNIPTTVKRIEDGWCEFVDVGLSEDYGAFVGCKNLTTVNIPADSRLEYIGKMAFQNCVKLSKIQLPSSIRTLAERCFDGCTALKQLTLPEGLQTFGQSVLGRSGIEKLHIPASCTFFHFINGAAANLKEYTVAAGNPFYKAHQGVLYTRIAPTGDYTGWTLVSYPKGKTDTSYTVPDFCTHIYGDIFVVSSDIPSAKLKEIHIRNCDAAPAPGGDNSLSRIRFRIVPGASSPYYTSVNGMLLSKDQKKLIQVPSDMTGTLVIPDGVEVINDYALEHGSYTQLILPEGLKSLGDAAFWQTPTVKAIYIPGSVENLGGSLFQECYKLMDVYYGGAESSWLGTFEASSEIGAPMYLAPYFEKHFHSKSAVTAANCVNDGAGTVQCGDCGKSISYSSPAPGHSYKDKVCTVCGYVFKTVSDSVPMFRMYDPNSSEHFYTGSTEERDGLIKAGWNYEGVGFNFPKAGSPVHRLYHEPTGEHLYTMSEEEKAALLAAGWNYEGVAFNSAGTNEVRQYRLHNPNATRGAYHFTSSAEERDHLISIGWEYQGIGWYSCLQ